MTAPENRDAWAVVCAIAEALNEACRQMVERQTTQRDVAPMEEP